MQQPLLSKILAALSLRRWTSLSNGQRGKAGTVANADLLFYAALCSRNLIALRFDRPRATCSPAGRLLHRVELHKWHVLSLSAETPRLSNKDSVRCLAPIDGDNLGQAVRRKQRWSCIGAVRRARPGCLFGDERADRSLT